MDQLREADFRFAFDTEGQYMLALFSDALHIGRRLEKAKTQHALDLLIKLEESLSNLDKLYEGNTAVINTSAYVDQMVNVRFTAEAIGAAHERGDATHAAKLCKYQLRCFLQELREEIYFWAYVQPFPDRLSVYYQDEFAAHHKNEYLDQGNTAYEVSLFVPAKDKLEYTKQCVESILRETDQDQINYELILINHGSQDETQEYFESIPGAKVLHLKHNVRMIVFSSAVRVCEGRYAVFVSNDTVVTKDWLALLLQCIRSDSSIISVTPTTPNVSNFQGTPEAYSDMQQMAVFAQGFNQHDPKKWERRARIMPIIALYDLEKLNRIGLADRYYKSMEFWDDDFSLRARRAGYKQLLCRDVFCHHFGSITGKEAQKSENTLQVGKQLFTTKHGVDPWENGAYYDYPVCSRLEGTIQSGIGATGDVLGIDCGFGDTPLQIANLLKRCGQDSQVDNVTTQRQYAMDLKGISRDFLLAQDEDDLHQILQQMKGREYAYIYVSTPLEQFVDWRGMLNRLSALLAPGGTLIFWLTNALDLINIQWFYSLALSPARERLNYLNPEIVSKHMQSQLQDVSMQRKRGWANTELLSHVAKRMKGIAFPEEVLLPMLDTVGFQFFGCKVAP